MNAPDKPAAHRATNLHLEAALVDEARRLGVNLSRAAEAGLRRAAALRTARTPEPGLVLPEAGEVALFPQLIAALPRAELGQPVGSLALVRDRIRAALDMALLGF